GVGLMLLATGGGGTGFVKVARLVPWGGDGGAAIGRSPEPAAGGRPGAFAAARLPGGGVTCQFLRGDGDGIPTETGCGLAVASAGIGGPPVAAAHSRGISSAGGGGIGDCIHGCNASISSCGV